MGLIITSLVFSQEIENNFEHISVEDDLPHSSVATGIQGMNGYLWFGLNGGLAKYNGYEFKYYTPDKSKANTLSGTGIKTIVEDTASGNHYLWIGTNSGLNRFDIKRSVFKSFFPESDNARIKHNRINSLKKINDSTLWVGTMSGLFSFNIFNSSFTSLHPDTSKRASKVSDLILNEKTGRIWVALSEKTYYYDPGDKSFHSINVQEGFDEIDQFLVDRSGDLWAANNKGLHKFDQKKNKFELFSFNQINTNNEISSVNQLYSFGDDRILICSDIGLLSFEKTSKTFHRIAWHDKNKPESLSSKNPSFVLKDHSGMIWIGTFKDGLNKFNPDKKQFKIFPGPSQNFVHQPDNIYGIYEDHNGNMWMGSYGNGLFLFDPQANDVHQIYSHDVEEGKLPDKYIFHVFADSYNILWVANGGYGLNALDLNKFSKDYFKSGKTSGQPFLKNYLPEAQNPSSISGWSHRYVYEDRNKNLWIASTDGGLNLYNREKDNFTSFLPDIGDSTSIMDKKLWVIYEPPKEWEDTLFIGSDNKGLILMDVKQGTFSQFNYDHLPYLKSGSIRSIHQDNKGNIWLGIAETGLVKLEFSENHVVNHKLYTVDDGLANNMIYGILEDQNRNLWISTEQGLVKFDKQNEVFTTYTTRDGTSDLEYNFNSRFYNDINGMMFFGGVNGITYFHPDSIIPNLSEPKTVISKLLIYNKTVNAGDTINNRVLLDQNIEYSSEITLFHEENIVTLEFVGLHYDNPAMNKYAYMLEGFEDQWNYVNSKRRYATYTNLKQGSYKFKVKTANSDGIWDEEPAELNIKILPPFWKTWWAFMIYVGIIISLLLLSRLIITYRLQYKKQLAIERLEFEKQQVEFRKKNELERLKTRFFTNISHEFRTPLTLILGPLEALMQKISKTGFVDDQIKMVHRNANRLLRLVNQLLDLRKFEEGTIKLHISRGDLPTFLKDIYESFLPLTKQQSIKYSFQNITGANNAERFYFDSDTLEKILYNLLSNAFKFTPRKGQITLKARLSDDREMVQIEVVDNGIGIHNEQLEHIFDRFFQIEGQKTHNFPGSGIGLSLTKELIDLHHGKMSVRSIEGEGSTFSVTIPVKKKLYESYELTSESGLYELPSGEENNNFSDIAQDINKNNGVDPKNDADRALILVIDDHHDMRLFIKSNLSNQHQIIEAADGAQGLDLACQYVPDLIISDVMMPKINGTEFCRQIKRNETTSHIPVLLVTAKVSEESEMEGLLSGADDYITKPFNVSLLGVKVGNILKTLESQQNKFKNASHSEITKLATNKTDQLFLDKALEIIKNHISDDDFNNDAFIKEIGFSKGTLYKKLKAITGKSLSEFIRSVKMKYAAELLHNKDLRISEVAHLVGFNIPAHFTRAFVAEFDCSPTDYRDKNS